MLKRLFAPLMRPRPTKIAGARLYAAAAAQARTPAFYLEGGVPDTPEGRFELYTLHIVLMFVRLKGQGEAAAEVAQAAFDTYLQALDDSLREMGVGDLSMARKMRKLGEASYGRMRSYDQALSQLPDLSGLEAVIGRTVYAGLEGMPTLALAAYVALAMGTLESQDVAALCAGEVAWPKVTL